MPASLILMCFDVFVCLASYFHVLGLLNPIMKSSLLLFYAKYIYFSQTSDLHLWETPSLHPMAKFWCRRVMAVYAAVFLAV